MRIKRVTIKSFKRFHNLTIQSIPDTAKLVVMTGANGCGKSSVFDAFLTWHRIFLNIGYNYDKDYHSKVGIPESNRANLVNIDFHQPLLQDKEQNRKMFHFRSAYRNEADVLSTHIQKIGEEHDLSRIQKFIDNDVSVLINYQRLVAETLNAIYTGTRDQLSVQELREELIGQIRESMLRVFDDLVLDGIKNILESGTFFFTKGASQGFRYKNLSGGEKAAFDLLLDLIVKKDYFNDTVFCIDEPETHLNNRVQSKLLQELFNLITDNSQLWIATHSIGMMHCAKSLQEANPKQVLFLDFNDKDFDLPQILEPHPVNRTFWQRTLRVTLDELSEFIIPQQLVICEGNPKGTGKPKNAEFDARCYENIFSTEFPDTQFISTGAANDVEADRLALVQTIKAIAKGVKVIRLVDRDDRTEEEVKDCIKQGTRVLSHRNIESYLFADEVLVLLCQKYSQQHQVSQILEAKKSSIQKSIDRGNPPDDIKSASGDIYNEVKKILKLTKIGNDNKAFARDTLAPLITPETEIYKELKKDIFGDNVA